MLTKPRPVVQCLLAIGLGFWLAYITFINFRFFDRLLIPSSSFGYRNDFTSSKEGRSNITNVRKSSFLQNGSGSSSSNNYNYNARSKLPTLISAPTRQHQQDIMKSKIPHNSSKEAAHPIMHATKTYPKITMDDPSIQKLKNLGMNITESQLQYIPSWQQVTDMFGTEPVIIGLEQCEAFRKAVPFSNRTVLPAGSFNTGTNLFPEFFHTNCAGSFQRDIIQVNWGKHNLANARIDGYVINKPIYQAVPQEHILPVIMVRHPVTWMFSTCVHSYGARWKHNETNCPHLVNENKTDGSLVPLRVDYGYNHNGRTGTRYPSLIHFWRDWYQSYAANSLTFPRLMVRLEDVVYHPDIVLKKLCDCVGGRQRYDRIYVHKESVKMLKDRQRIKRNLTGSLTRGKETSGLISAWTKHASIASFWRKMNPRDQRAVKQTLELEDDLKLLKLFHYTLDGII